MKEIYHFDESDASICYFESDAFDGVYNNVSIKELHYYVDPETVYSTTLDPNTIFSLELRVSGSINFSLNWAYMETYFITTN